MTLLLLGASDDAVAVIREIAATLSIALRTDASAERPDWVLTATEPDRQLALRRFALPSHRVIHLGELRASGNVNRDRMQVALSRMMELGAMSAPPPQIGRWIANRALPLLHEWATWLAADEARQKLAAHSSFLRSKNDASIKGKLMFAVPDTRALASLRGLLIRLSRERHEVHVAIAHMSPDDPVVTSLEGHWGFTVGHALRSGPSASGIKEGTRSGRFNSWVERRRPLNLDVIGLLEDRKPNVLVVVPHHDATGVEADYFRVARWLGIRSICLPLRWDGVEASRRLRHGLPDLFATWNDAQQQKTIGTFNVTSDRVPLTGAILPSDVVEGHAILDRSAYCTRMGIDPSRRIVLIDAPTVSSHAWITQFQEWRRCLTGSANPETHDAAVVVYVENPDAVAMWRQLAPTAGILVARAGTAEERIAFRLVESLAAADVVVATGLTFALEAVSRRKPTVVFAGAGGADAEELERFLSAYPSLPERLTIARGASQAAARIVTALTHETSTDAIRQAASIVRPDGDTGTGHVYRLLARLAQEDYGAPPPVRPPLWQRMFVWMCDAFAWRSGRAASTRSQS